MMACNGSVYLFVVFQQTRWLTDSMLKTRTLLHYITACNANARN